MDKLKKTAIAYENLLGTKYKFTLGRKGKTSHIELVFSEWDYHHLMGLGKLKDLRISRENRKIVFQNILLGKITYEQISKSRYFNEIKSRFIFMERIEEILDSDEIIFKYHAKQNIYSRIEADYLLSTPYQEDVIYLFISELENSKFFCRSFFPKSNKDYTQNQPTYKILNKEKVRL